MGGSKTSAPGARSLDRLKTLDSFPNLDLQLSEARELCTSPERASMVTRWLLDKLRNKSLDAQNSDMAWRLLCFSIRLLSPEKVATLLGQFDILDIVQDTIRDASTSESVVEALSQFMMLLMATSKGVRGVHLQALLKVEADKAATFAGAWMQAAVYARRNKIASIAVSPALDIWSFRKRSTDDNDSFARFCLVPAAHFLFHKLNVGPHGEKRKSDVDDIYIDESKVCDSLERLLAQHVFQPARLSFFSDQSVADLDLKLERLKASDEDGMLIPLLVDIALRVAPVITPKQRKEEQNWADAVFKVLEQKLAGDDAPTAVASKATIESMLDTIYLRGFSLSHNNLSDIISERTSLLEQEIVDPTDWSIIERIVRLDASFFLEDPFARTLFDRLPSSGDRVSVATIVNPIMKAYARHRILPQYLQRWEEQVLKDTATIWSTAALKDVMRDSLSLAQIDHLIDRYNSWLAKGQDSERIAATVLLYHILSAIGSVDPEIWEATHEKCGTILLAAMDTANQDLGKRSLPEMWQLPRRAFEMWFPLWAAKQSEAKVVAQGLALLEHESLSKACNEHTVDVRESAHCFVATLCRTFHRYSSCHEACEKYVLRVVESDGAAAVLKSDPSLFTLLPSELVSSSIGLLLTRGSEARAVVEPLVLVAAQSEQLCETIVAAACSKINSTNEPWVLELISAIVLRSPTASKSIRNILFPTVATTLKKMAQAEGNVIFPRRLAWLIQLLETRLPNPLLEQTIAALLDLRNTEDGTTALLLAEALRLVQQKSVQMGLEKEVEAAIEMLSQRSQTENGILTNPVTASSAELSLRHALTPRERQTVSKAYRKWLLETDGTTKRAACEDLLEAAFTKSSSSLPLLSETLITLTKNDFESDVDGTAFMSRVHARILKGAQDSALCATGGKATACTLFLLKERRHMINQHAIESTLAVCCNLLKQPSAIATFGFFDVCKMVTALLQYHEHRLRGRFHLMCLTLQHMLTVLLRPIKSVGSKQSSFKSQQARALSRVLTFFCNPRQVQTSTHSLVDEARKAKAHVGEFARHLLHHYCAEVLKHPPTEDVRKPLTLGLYAIIEAIETSTEHGIESLSDAMNNSQRGILRSVYGDWRTFGKWKPG